MLDSQNSNFEKDKTGTLILPISVQMYPNHHGGTKLIISPIMKIWDLYDLIWYIFSRFGQIHIDSPATFRPQGGSLIRFEELWLKNLHIVYPTTMGIYVQGRKQNFGGPT